MSVRMNTSTYDKKVLSIITGIKFTESQLYINTERDCTNIDSCCKKKFKAFRTI